MVFIGLFVFVIACVALISCWFNVRNIDRVEKRVHNIQIYCEELAKKQRKLNNSLKRAKEKFGK